MSIHPELRWERTSDRVYFCYRGKNDVGLVFGAPSPMQLWCSVVWIDRGRGGHRAKYHGRLSAAKRWVYEQNSPGIEHANQT